MSFVMQQAGTASTLSRSGETLALRMATGPAGQPSVNPLEKMMPDANRVMAYLAIAAGLACGVAAAQAAGRGLTIDPAQEQQVRSGMSADEVKNTIGEPMRVERFANQPGPTFAYDVAGSEQTLFEVEFDADGRVATARERIDDIAE